MARFPTRLSITGRIAAGFGLVLLVTGVSGGIAALTMMTSGRLVEHYNAVLHVASAFGEARSNFSEGRIAGEAFMLSLDPDKLSQADGAVAGSRRNLANAIGPVSGPAVRDAMKALDSRYDAYAALIKDLQRGGLHAESALQLASLGQDVIRQQNETNRLLQAQATSIGDEIGTTLFRATGIALATLAAAFVIGCLTAYLVGRSIAKPLVHLTKAMVQVAAGHVDTPIAALTRGDELGAMARALEVFKHNARQIARTAEIRAQDEQRLAAERRSDMLALADGFELSVKGAIELVNSHAEHLRTSSHSLSEIASGTKTMSVALASRAGEAATGINLVVGSVDELVSLAASIAEAAETSSSMAKEAEASSRFTADMVEGLQQSIGAVGEVLDLIRAVASQTNLLALNATIEAARAGESGRGFAVVASEVKALATQTSDATRRIGTQIDEIKTASARATEAMKTIGASLSGLSGMASTIANSASMQLSTVDEIARSTQQVANATSIVSQDATDMSAGANRTADAARITHQAAEGLGGEAKRLDHELLTFTASVRAA